MTPIWLRTTYKTVELGTALLLIAGGIIIFIEAWRLGPGWGHSGPRPGFFPFVLTIMIVVGAMATIYAAIRKPDARPFFEASQEVTDLLKVGLPVAATVATVPYLGIYLTSGLYMAFFMAWYGKFKWYWAIFGGIAFPLVLWLVLRYGFNIPMPMSMWYRQGILPF